MDRQFALVGLEYRAGHGDDVANIPLFERGIGVFAERATVKIDLDAAATILQGGEARLAHDAFEHHPARDRGRMCGGGECFLLLVVVGIVQRLCPVCRHEIVGKGDALGAKRGKLDAPLGDQSVFVVLGNLWLGHDQEG